MHGLKSHRCSLLNVVPILSIWVEPEKRLEPILEREVLSAVPRLEVTVVMEVMARPSSARRLARRALRSAGLRMGSASKKSGKYIL